MAFEDARRCARFSIRPAFFALTYYPMSPDFVVRDPSTVDADFPRILAAAGSKQIFLQEVGYPTSPTNGSSEEKQAEVFSRVLDQVAGDPARFIGVNFTFMSDFSDSLVKSFSAYYRMPGADRFGSFLKTLGMFDDQGRPKKAWAVFARVNVHGAPDVGYRAVPSVNGKFQSQLPHAGGHRLG